MNRLRLGNTLGYLLLAGIVTFGIVSNNEKISRIHTLTMDEVIATHAQARILADDKGYIIDATPKAVALFDTTAAKLIGSRVNDWMPEAERQEHLMQYAKAMRGGELAQPAVVHCRGIKGDGTITGELEIEVRVIISNQNRYAVAVFRELPAEPESEE